VPLHPAAAPAETMKKTIEDKFKELTQREDIAVVLISQYVAGTTSPPISDRTYYLSTYLIPERYDKVRQTT
jgi:hypothetical protein